MSRRIDELDTIRALVATAKSAQLRKYRAEPLSEAWRIADDEWERATYHLGHDIEVMDAFVTLVDTMLHDLETSAGLWAVDHELPNEPDAFQLRHASLGTIFERGGIGT